MQWKEKAGQVLHISSCLSSPSLMTVPHLEWRAVLKNRTFSGARLALFADIWSPDIWDTTPPPTLLYWKTSILQLLKENEFGFVSFSKLSGAHAPDPKDFGLKRRPLSCVHCGPRFVKDQHFEYLVAEVTFIFFSYKHIKYIHVYCSAVTRAIYAVIHSIGWKDWNLRHPEGHPLRRLLNFNIIISIG